MSDYIINGLAIVGFICIYLFLGLLVVLGVLRSNEIKPYDNWTTEDKEIYSIFSWPFVLFLIVPAAYIGAGVRFLIDKVKELYTTWQERRRSGAQEQISSYQQAGMLTDNNAYSAFPRYGRGVDVITYGQTVPRSLLSQREAALQAARREILANQERQVRLGIFDEPSIVSAEKPEEEYIENYSGFGDWYKDTVKSKS